MKKLNDNERDLRHFLALADSQLEHRLNKAATTQPYSGSINRMHLLQELIKEQIPSDRNDEQRDSNSAAKNSRSTTGEAR